MTNNISTQLERWNALLDRAKRLTDEFPDLLWNNCTVFSERKQRAAYHRFVATIGDKGNAIRNLPVIDAVFALDDDFALDNDAEIHREITLHNLKNHILFLERCHCYPTSNTLDGVFHNAVKPERGVFIDRLIIRVESLDPDHVTVTVMRLDAPDEQEVIPLKMFVTSHSFLHVQKEQLFMADFVDGKINAVIPIKPTWNEAQLNAMTELQRRAIEELIVI